MSEDAQYRNEGQQVAERTPCACPFCGHDGAFDGMGSFSREILRIRADGSKTTERVWHEEIHCFQCDNIFTMRGTGR